MHAIQRRVVRPAMLVAMILGLGSLCGQARAQETQAQRHARQALPQANDLPGFGEFRYTSLEQFSSLRAVRWSDGMAVHVTIQIGRDMSETEAYRKDAATDHMGLPGTMPTGTRSGREVGNQAWHSRYHRGGPPRGAYSFGCRLGRAVIVVALMHRITPGAGKPIHQVFSDEDLRWAEDVAIGCVERLKKMGYGDENEKKAQSKTKGKSKPKGK